MAKPSPTSHPGYFQRYIDLVEEEDLAAGFSNQLPRIHDLLDSVSEELANHAYADGKWTLKELLQHMIDAERIFAYRALCFARGEEQALPGFEENDYADKSDANQRSWRNLTDEFLTVRRSTEMLFNSFSPGSLARMGTANNNRQSVASIGFVMIGHVNHHLQVMRERYLNS